MKVTGYFLDPVTFIITFPSITYQKHVNLPFLPLSATFTKPTLSESNWGPRVPGYFHNLLISTNLHKNSPPLFL